MKPVHYVIKIEIIFILGWLFTARLPLTLTEVSLSNVFDLPAFSIHRLELDGFVI